MNFKLESVKLKIPQEYNSKRVITSSTRSLFFSVVKHFKNNQNRLVETIIATSPIKTNCSNNLFEWDDLHRTCNKDVIVTHDNKFVLKIYQKQISLNIINLINFEIDYNKLVNSYEKIIQNKKLNTSAQQNFGYPLTDQPLTEDDNYVLYFVHFDQYVLELLFHKL